eukprot:5541340-Prorocentrum_lima.AAC.1
MKTRIGLLQQQVGLARETLDKEREKAGRLQAQAERFSPAGLRAEFTPSSIQRTYGSMIQANSVVVPPLRLAV